MRSIDLRFAILFLQPFNPNLMKVGVVYGVLAEEPGEDIGRKVL